MCYNILCQYFIFSLKFEISNIEILLHLITNKKYARLELKLWIARRLYIVVDDTTTAISLHVALYNFPLWLNVTIVYAGTSFTVEKRRIFRGQRGSTRSSRYGMSSAVNVPITSRLLFSKRILIFLQFIYRIPRHIIFRFIARVKIQRCYKLSPRSWCETAINPCYMSEFSTIFDS